MKKQIMVIVILGVLVIGLWYWKNGSNNGLFADRVTITAPVEGEAIIQGNENLSVVVEGKATPKDSVFIYDANEACITSRTPSLGSGGVNEVGIFSITLQNGKDGNNRIKVASLSEEEEKEYMKKEDCYPNSFFSKSRTFILTKARQAELPTPEYLPLPGGGAQNPMN